MGNAHYKLNRIAPSILNYEKAHLLDPTNEDIQHNLRFAQNMTIDVIEELPPNAFDAFINRLSVRFPPIVEWIGDWVIGIGVFGIAVYLQSRQSRQKRQFFVLSLLLAC